MKLSLIQLAGKNIQDYENTADYIIKHIEECCFTDTDLILLPECAYPGYFIGLSSPDCWKNSLLKLKNSIAQLAKTHAKYIAIGLADYKKESLINALSVFDPSGKIICTTAKSNLWHFDSNWFDYGTDFPVFDTPFGKIGLMVCADGRIPEIARSLKLQGAQLILDAVNLVSSAETPSALTNQQYNFMLKERARENSLYIAVCDKCGIEDSSVTMIGRSMVISPEGTILAECDSVNEQILTCEIDLSQTGSIPVRQTEDYSALIKPTKNLPAYELQKRLYSLKDLEFYTGIIKYPFTTTDEYKEKALYFTELCKKANCRLAILPYAKNMDLSSIYDSLLRAADNQIILCAGYGEKEQLVITNQIFSSKSSISQRVIELTNELSISFLFDDEYSVPENVRIQMLMGSDLIIWCDSSPDSKKLALTRSAENKIFTVRSVPSNNEAAYMVTPDGSVIATTFQIPEHTVFAMLFTALSRTKTVVPGTDIIMSRHPEAYERLIK